MRLRITVSHDMCIVEYLINVSVAWFLIRLISGWYYKWFPRWYVFRCNCCLGCNSMIAFICWLLSFEVRWIAAMRLWTTLRQVVSKEGDPRLSSALSLTFRSRSSTWLSSFEFRASQDPHFQDRKNGYVSSRENNSAILSAIDRLSPWTLSFCCSLQERVIGAADSQRFNSRTLVFKSPMSAGRLCAQCQQAYRSCQNFHASGNLHL